MLLSAVTGSERTLALGVDLVLEVVRMAVNKQFPSLMPTIFPSAMVTDPKPYASLNKMWIAFGDLANDKTPAVNGNIFLLCLFLRRERGHPPRRGPGLPVMGAAREECRLRRLHGRRDRAIIRFSCL